MTKNFLARGSLTSNTELNQSKFVLSVEGPSEGLIAVQTTDALVGRSPCCEVVLDDPGIDLKQLYLHLDSRGLVVIDVGCGIASRIGREQKLFGLLNVGDFIEVGEWRLTVSALESEINDSWTNESDYDLLNDSPSTQMVEITLYPDGGSPLRLHSQFVFIGTSRNCGIRIEDDSAEPIHCVIHRTPDSIHLIDLAKHDVSVNDKWIHRSIILQDDDILTIGHTRFLCKIASQSQSLIGSSFHPPTLSITADTLGPLSTSPDTPTQLVLTHSMNNAHPLNMEEQLVSWFMSILASSHGEIVRRQSSFHQEILQAINSLHTNQTAITTQNQDKLQGLQSEIIGFREEIRGYLKSSNLNRIIEPQPATTHRTPSGNPALADNGMTAAWLMQRIQQVNQENKPGRKAL